LSIHSDDNVAARLATEAGRLLLAVRDELADATAAQPHMVNALNALQTARSELGMAEHDKGGHLPIAIERIDQAINQVHLGMAAAGG